MECLRQIKGLLERNWLRIVIGTPITIFLVYYCKAVRGYAAYGGEWLLIPILVMGHELVRMVKRDLPKMLQPYEEGEEDDEVDWTEAESKKVPKSQKNTVRKASN